MHMNNIDKPTEAQKAEEHALFVRKYLAGRNMSYAGIEECANEQDSPDYRYLALIALDEEAKLIRNTTKRKQIRRVLHMLQNDAPIDKFDDTSINLSTGLTDLEVAEHLEFGTLDASGPLIFCDEDLEWNEVPGKGRSVKSHAYNEQELLDDRYEYNRGYNSYWWDSYGYCGNSPTTYHKKIPEYDWHSATENDTTGTPTANCKANCTTVIPEEIYNKLLAMVRELGKEGLEIGGLLKILLS